MTVWFACVKFSDLSTVWYYIVPVILKRTHLTSLCDWWWNVHENMKLLYKICFWYRLIYASGDYSLDELWLKAAQQRPGFAFEQSAYRLYNQIVLGCVFGADAVKNTDVASSRHTSKSSLFSKQKGKKKKSGSKSYASCPWISRFLWLASGIAVVVLGNVTFSSLNGIHTGLYTISDAVLHQCLRVKTSTTSERISNFLVWTETGIYFASMAALVQLGSPKSHLRSTSSEPAVGRMHPRLDCYQE